MLYEIDGKIIPTFFTGVVCKIFEEYCKNADALLNYDKLRAAKATSFYGTMFYPDKMIEKYGEDYMTKFDKYIDDEKRKSEAKDLVNQAIDLYLSGMREALEFDKEGSKNDV